MVPQVGPFIKLGPLRNVEGVAEISGSLSGAGVVVILSLCLTLYGATAFQNDRSQVGVKTLSGAEPSETNAAAHSAVNSDVCQCDYPGWFPVARRTLFAVTHLPVCSAADDHLLSSASDQAHFDSTGLCTMQAVRCPATSCRHQRAGASSPAVS